MSEGWSLTESDPAIFTSLLQELGVRGLEVSELYSLDAALLESLQPIHALIFLFKYVDPLSTAASLDPSLAGTSREDVEFYFAHQVINNACATMALLNAVMNLDDGGGGGGGGGGTASTRVQLGKELEELKSFSLALDPGSRGWAVSNSEKIREGASCGAVAGDERPSLFKVGIRIESSFSLAPLLLYTAHLPVTTHPPILPSLPPSFPSSLPHSPQQLRSL